jgi:TolB-like protein/Tfp pilus assembly protein PilF
MRNDFRLGDWLVQPSLVRISKPGQMGHVRAKVMDLLVYFAQHPGEVIAKDILLHDVWGTDAISESALTRTITELRQALGDDVDEPTILETIPKRGYRLIAPVTEAPNAMVMPAARMSSDDPQGFKKHYVPPSIAVLPFADMSPARDHDWFCEGIAEEILNALATLPGLRVATRTSAFRFKDPARDLRTIGETLGVTTLLEGSVRTAGSRLRVTAQLVTARDGYQLWSERFDRQMEDVFAIQDEIATKVVAALELQLAGVGAGPARHSDDLGAYHLFLKGRNFRYTKLDLESARRCFEEAISRDPAYALARIALAETLVILVLYGMIPPSAGQAQVKEELRTARALGEESGLALGVEALSAFLFDWDTRAALDAFERALELDPTHIPVRGWYTWVLVAVCRPDEALKQARRIVQMDPQSPYANAMAGMAHLLAERVDEAIKLERRAVDIAPDSLQATWLLGLALAGASAWEEAIEWFGRAVNRSSRTPAFLGMLAWCQAAAGRHEEAQQTLRELERRALGEYVSPIFRAWAVSELDDPDKTRTLLGEAFAERAGVLAVQGMPWFRQLRADPLMRDLRQRLLGEEREATSS